jgi:Toprim domain
MTSAISASELARRLARQAQAVCRHYLRAGHKEGRYWLVGDARGTPGRSLYVRLSGPEFGKGAAGKWTDAATNEHGDLLDLIGLNCGLTSVRSAMDEARAFLSLPVPPVPSPPHLQSSPSPRESSESARRLFAMSKPIAGTVADVYLRRRGIDPMIADVSALRFHPRCYYRDGDRAPTRTFPALIAAVTDGEGRITGVHRTWLDPEHAGEKAPVGSPRRAMGDLLGSGVRFGVPPQDALPVVAAGEGLETMMSLRIAMPVLPMIAGLSANHLAAILLPSSLRRLYIAVDADPAGRHGMERLSRRARQAGIEVLTLVPRRGDFNDDLRHLGRVVLARGLRDQLVPEDAARYLITA